MAYVVFKVEKDMVNKIDEILKDDIVSRQSIVVRDASALGIKIDARLVFLEGNEKAIQRARELFKDIGSAADEAVAKKVHDKIREEESSAASGMGMIFG